LHGTNTEQDILRYQIGLFSEIFKDVAELFFIDAPNILGVPMEKAFVDRGFTKPGRVWFKWQEGYVFPNRHCPDKETDEPLIPYDFEDSLIKILKEIDNNGPYDGILAFSSGSIIYRLLHLFVHSLDPNRFALKENDFPKFIISFSGPNYPIKF
jgi:hypothetical protein